VRLEVREQFGEREPQTVATAELRPDGSVAVEG